MKITRAFTRIVITMCILFYNGMVYSMQSTHPQTRSLMLPCQTRVPSLAVQINTPTFTVQPLPSATKNDKQECPICGKWVVWLAAHKRSHNQKRLYKCSYSGCNKAFFRKSHLQNHHSVHTGQRPFKCIVVLPLLERSP